MQSSAFPLKKNDTNPGKFIKPSKQPSQKRFFGFVRVILDLKSTHVFRGVKNSSGAS